jgi:hypothetical protein
MEEHNGKIHFFMIVIKVLVSVLFTFLWPVSPSDVHTQPPTFQILFQLWSKVILVLKGRGRKAVLSESPCNTRWLISSDIYLRS